MVFNTTFNNISVISWQSVLLMEETGGPGENHRPVLSHLVHYEAREVYLFETPGLNTHNLAS